MMSYTHPNGQPQGTATQTTNKLRELLIGEIIAINGYQSHIANSNIELINNVWHSIMMDEKTHYGKILTLLRKYDPEQQIQYLAHMGDFPVVQIPAQGHPAATLSSVILNNLREDIKGELEAVILYEAELPKFQQHDIRVVLKSIIDEEKGHAEHLTRLLLKYDPDSYDPLN